MAGFSFDAGDEQSTAWLSVPEIMSAVHEGLRGPLVMLSLEGGEAVVDPGAGSDTIGEPSFNKLIDKLVSCGLKVIPLTSTWWRPVASAAVRLQCARRWCRSSSARLLVW